MALFWIRTCLELSVMQISIFFVPLTTLDFHLSLLPVTHLSPSLKFIFTIDFSLPLNYDLKMFIVYCLLCRGHL